jgi:hypothetical protein
MTGQVIVIAALATSFTAACERCAAIDGRSSSIFAGRLDLDLDEGVFLCRRGHHVRVERAEPAEETELAAAS